MPQSSPGARTSARSVLAVGWRPGSRTFTQCQSWRHSAPGSPTGLVAQPPATHVLKSSLSGRDDGPPATFQPPGYSAGAFTPLAAMADATGAFGYVPPLSAAPLVDLT